MTEPEPRAAIYARISQHDPTYNKTDAQTRDLRALAEREGYVVVAEFEDDGISAARVRGKVKARPGFDDLLDAIGSGGIDVVLAVEESRFDRDGVAKRQLELVCAEARATWHTAREGKIDPADEADEFISGMRLLMDRQEVRKRTRRQTDRYEREVQAGRPLWGNRPFGYQADRLTPHPEEADEVRWAYSEFMKHGKVYPILAAWNARGVRTVAGNQWCYASVQKLLKRPRNAGIVLRRGVPVEGVKAAWDPLIDRSIYDDVLAIMSDPGRRTTDKGRKPSSLLAGIARCDAITKDGTRCGRVMRSATGNGEPYLKCETKVNAQGIGERHAMIATRLIDPLVIEAVLDAYMHAPRALLPGTEEAPDVGPIRADLARVRGERERIKRLTIAGAIEESEGTADLLRLKGEEEALVERRDAIVREASRVSLVADLREGLWTRKGHALAKAARLRSTLRERWSSLEIPARRDLVRVLLDVTIDAGRRIERVNVTHKVATGLDQDQEAGIA